ncbi:hypothetical protein [Janthinobacterium sp. UMAB-60]|uniref:hypothetical protein n=1 Tax=Janthinobacterium sp. UMAB-60 TaxID=1365365 RepID=UPI001C56B0D1|nr:hypothetical protein [Janthinobacterium sp. UMAB-60]
MRIDLAPPEHDFSVGQRAHGRYIAAIILLHLALFWAATRPVHTRIEHDDRVWLQLMPTLPPTRGFIPPAEPDPAPARPPAVPSSVASVSPPKEATAPLQDPPQDDALPAEPVPAAPKTAPLPLAQQALQAVGAIDRQLRSEHPQEFVAPPETAHTRLAKGFAEAHAAVKPKWFEAARIELWSAPNDPKRIYRVITATGEYCIYLPDKGNMTLNLSARSGYAGFGEGTAAPCPIRF